LIFWKTEAHPRTPFSPCVKHLHKPEHSVLVAELLGYSLFQNQAAEVKVAGLSLSSFSLFSNSVLQE
jgi:hypothetical protein